MNISGGSAGKNYNSKITFKETLKGYNKDDVNAYLEEMHLRFASVEEDYKRTINNQRQTIDGLEFKIDTYDQLCSELAQLKEKLAEKDGRFEENRKKFEEYEQLMSELNAKTSQLASECDGLSEKLSAATAENSILIDENADIGKELQTMRELLADRDNLIEELKAEAEGLRKNSIKTADIPARQTQAAEQADKKQVYDEMSRKLGSLMIIAKESADKLIAEATAESEKIIERANSDAEQIRSDAIAEGVTLREAARIRLENSLDSANRKLFSMSEDYIHNYAEYLRSVQSEFETMITGLREKSNEIKSKVDKMRAMISDELELEFDRIIRDMHTETSAGNISEDIYTENTKAETETINEEA